MTSPHQSPEQPMATPDSPKTLMAAPSSYEVPDALIISAFGSETGEMSPKWPPPGKLASGSVFGQWYPKPMLMKLEKPFILPHFGSEIGDGESISLPPEPTELAEVEASELSEAAFENQPVGDGLRTRGQLYANLHKKRKQIGDGESIWLPPQSPDQAYLEAPGMTEAELAAFHKKARENLNALFEKRKNQIEGRGVESVTRPPKPPEMELIEGQLFEKQLLDFRDGVSQTREEIYAIFESKRKPFPRDEEWINEHYCCLKNPQLIDNPDVTEIRVEDVKYTGTRIKAYTRLPRFRENLPFCKKLEAYAIKMVEHFNSLKGENWCFDSVELVAAAPVRCYMLEFKVPKGGGADRRRMMMRGSVCGDVIEEVMDAGVIEEKDEEHEPIQFYVKSR